MQLTLRWYGPSDPVRLGYIRQIPGVTGIVASLYHVPPGETWKAGEVAELKDAVENAGLQLSVIESIPVHESIKLGSDDRDRYIEAFAESIEVVGRAGIPVVCYNFMPVFDWTRTDLARSEADGSTSLAYDDAALDRIDLSLGTTGLPGWATAYSPEELGRLRRAYRSVDEARLWDNFAYFLERVVPSAEKAGVKLAIHPDDPPWPVFDLPRIIVDETALKRVLDLVDSPASGLTLCTGSLGPRPDNDLPGMIRRLGSTGRIHFAHCRNIRRTGEKQFHESPHPTVFGDVNMLEVMRAYREIGFSGPIRPDHGRMIWGETGRPGYGLYDRALGAAYLLGLWEGTSRE